MAFRRIFWGMLFWLDFRLQGVDVLPDLIGYAMIWSALTELKPHAEAFGRARPFAIALTALSVLTVYQQPNAAGTFHLTGSLGFDLIGVVCKVLDLFLIWHICSGIRDVAQDRGNYALAEKATERWKYYFATTLLMIPATLMALVPMVGIVVFLILGVFALITYFLLMGLMRRADEELHL